LPADGSIKAWGDPSYGGEGAPKDRGYTKISSTYGTFAALKVNGSITAWGWHGVDGSKDAPLPRDSGYIDIYSNQFSFAAVKADGSITAWGNPNYGGKGAPD
jgi:alpha-tubulin suppressor-like RCC1 family protein